MGSGPRTAKRFRQSIADLHGPDVEIIELSPSRRRSYAQIGRPDGLKSRIFADKAWKTWKRVVLVFVASMAGLIAAILLGPKG